MLIQEIIILRRNDSAGNNFNVFPTNRLELRYQVRQQRFVSGSKR